MSARVETKRKKSNVSFTTTFVGVSGYPSAVGSYTTSPVVELGDRQWSLRIFPGGCDEESKGYLSCFVSYESRGQARAAFKVSIMNQKGWKDHSYSSDSVKLFVNSLDASDSAVWGDPRFVLRSDLRNESIGFCVDDKLVIKAELTVYGEIEQNILTSNAPAIGSPSRCRSLADEMSTLLLDDGSADVVIVAEEERIPAHRFILCLRSEVFRAMLRGGMSEAVSGEVRIADFQAAVVKEFLHFLYTDAVSCPREATLDAHGEALLAMACKYQVRGLETLCENHLCANLSVTNVVDILTLSDLYCAHHLKSRALLFISHNAKAVVQSEGFRSLAAELYPEVMKAVVGLCDDEQQHQHQQQSHSSPQHHKAGGAALSCSSADV